MKNRIKQKKNLQVKMSMSVITLIYLSGSLLSFQVAAANCDLNDGDYTFQQESTNQYLDAYTTGNNNHSVVTRTAQSNNSQVWEIDCVARVIRLSQVSNYRYLDAYNGINDDAVVTRREQDSNSQLWVNNNLGFLDHQALMQLSSNLYLDAYEDSDDNYQAVLRPYQDNDSQEWYSASVD